MSYETKQRFQLEGDFVAFGKMKKGTPKSLLLRCDGMAYELKIAKGLRSGIRGLLQPGSRVRIHGREKCQYDRSSKKESQPSKVKRKAVAITPLKQGSEIETRQPEAGRQVVVQVCTKANCWKRGGKQIWDRLKEIQAEQGSSENISLQPVHCLDRCKKGPCLRCLPERHIHCQMDTKHLPDLVKQKTTPKPDSHAEVP